VRGSLRRQGRLAALLGKRSRPIACRCRGRRIKSRMPAPAAPFIAPPVWAQWRRLGCGCRQVDADQRSLGGHGLTSPGSAATTACHRRSPQPSRRHASTSSGAPAVGPACERLLRAGAGEGTCYSGSIHGIKSEDGLLGELSLLCSCRPPVAQRFSPSSTGWKPNDADCLPGHTCVIRSPNGDLRAVLSDPVRVSSVLSEKKRSCSRVRHSSGGPRHDATKLGWGRV
jgi:hypothetical protein